MPSLILSAGVPPYRAFSRIGRCGVLLVAGLGLAACVETGDFGRRKPSLFDGHRLIDIAPALTLSDYTLTDDETEMRRRAFAFLAGPRAPVWPTPDLMELLLDESFEAYYGRLAGLPDRSPHARYQRLIGDIEADTTNLPLFRDVACRVEAEDLMRRDHLDRTYMPDFDRSEYLKRMADNQHLMDEVERHSYLRLMIYDKSLERLQLQSPDSFDRGVANALRQLRAVVRSRHACPTLKPDGL